ncbi:MAG: PepSY-like domain-containing protein [Bacteroidetes bacterium]|nr:PepSY-like domain-containing protein [Bacteroidota bacterium]
MKKLLYLLLIGASLLAVVPAKAQFGSVPGIVTDSFKVKYADAKSVSWSSKIGGTYQATFTQGSGTEKYVAKFGKKGEWKQTTKVISKDDMPAAVKDGLAKSKYANATEWEVREVTVIYLPGSVTQYNVLAAKNDIQKRNLLFSNDGRLLKDGNTL